MNVFCSTLWPPPLSRAFCLHGMQIHTEEKQHIFSSSETHYEISDAKNSDKS